MGRIREITIPSGEELDSNGLETKYPVQRYVIKYGKKDWMHTVRVTLVKTLSDMTDKKRNGRKNGLKRGGINFYG